MNIPRLEHPDRYQGLYVVDFGATTAVGYTADEVALLLESEAHVRAKVYRIYNARPDGTLELLGVPRERLLLEAGLMFYSRGLEGARADYQRLARLAQHQGFPCRAALFLAALGESDRLPFVVGLAYPAEYDRDVSRWMLDNRVAVGELADGGSARLALVRQRGRLLESTQLAGGRASRSRQEVLASVNQPIQRAG